MIELHPFNRLNYKEAHSLQLSLIDQLKSTSGSAGSSYTKHHLVLCEHPHTYTLGKSADRNHLLVNEAFLESIQAQTFRIERGGDITYHGPGQLVGYPILNLKTLGMGVKQYVHTLEQSIINTLQYYHITCYRIPKQIGLWVDQKDAAPKKIAAIGIKISQSISMHGFALNANTNLDYFNHIIPCGIPDKGVTSIALETGSDIDIQELASRYTLEFLKLFF